MGGGSPAATVKDTVGIQYSHSRCAEVVAVPVVPMTRKMTDEPAADAGTIAVSMPAPEVVRVVEPDTSAQFTPPSRLISALYAPFLTWLLAASLLLAYP